MSLRYLFLISLAAMSCKTPPAASLQTESMVWRVTAGPHVQPPQLGAAMSQYFDVVLLVRGTWSQDRVTFEVGSVGEDGKQDMCAPTGVFSADVAGGAFEVRGATIPFVTDGVGASLHDVTLTGTLGEAPTIQRIQGLFDSRPVADMAGDTPDAACVLLDKLIGCVPCGGGEPDTCWPIELLDVQLQATEEAFGEVTMPCEASG